jgi:peptide/nickel transport system substrate-binding protein
MRDQVTPEILLLGTERMRRRTFLKRAATLGLSLPGLSTLLAACARVEEATAPAGPSTSPIPTTGVEAVATPTALAKAPRPGGTVRHLIYEDPDTLNFIIGGTSIGRQVYQTLVEGLVGVDPDGNFYPILAAEIPTRENGGISDDFLTITWKLKPGVRWSDGAPFTSADVLFTYEAAISADSIIADRFSKIERIEAPDDHTVVIRYSEIDVGYLEQWRATYGCGIIPKHATGPVSEITRWEWNRKPIGTGPFKLEEWVSGDHVTVVRNEYYHEEGKPLLDRIDFLIVPSEEARAQMMLRGDAEIMLWPGETYTEDFERSGIVILGLAPGVWNARLWMNLSQPRDGNPGPEPPHWLFGDLRVRQAISMAINRERIVNEVLEGRVTLVTTPFPLGWYACEMPPYEYNPEKAKALMEEAGWVEGPDGIRVAQGARYAQDGTKAEVGLSTYSAFLPMELTALAIQEDLKKIGIKVNISIEDFAVIFGGWEDGAPRKTGDFDLLLYDTSIGGVEPHLTIRNTWHSASIPSANNPGGANYTRFNNPEADKLIDAAGSTLDLDARHDLYCQLVKIDREVLPIIYLYQFNEGNAYSVRLKGYTVSTWEWSTWDAKEWYLEE